MKKQFFIISLIILSFSFFKVSFAYTLISQPISDTNGNYNHTTGSTFQGLGNKLTGTLTSVTFHLNAQTATTSVHARISRYSNNTYGALEASLESSSTIINTTAQNYTFTFDTSGDPTNWFNTTKWYSIGLIFDSGSDYRWQGSANSSSYTGIGDTSTSSITYSCFASTECGSVADMFFLINVSGTIPNAISITYPTNGSSINDFSNWQVQASGEIAKIQISYENGFSSFTDTAGIYSTTNGYATFSIPKTHTLGISTSTYKSATPYILDENNNIVASGTTIYFLITGSATTTNSNYPNFLQTLLDNGIVGLNSWGIPYPTASSTQQCTWNSPLDCVTNAITQMVATAFTPHDISLSTIKNSMVQFQSVFPFSVPLTLLNSLQNDVSSTPTSQTLTLPIILGNNSTSVILLNASSMENVIGSSTKNQIFTNINYLLYTATGVVMFLTIF